MPDAADMKPQAKQLQARVESLLKMLGKQLEPPNAPSPSSGGATIAHKVNKNKDRSPVKGGEKSRRKRNKDKENKETEEGTDNGNRKEKKKKDKKKIKDKEKDGSKKKKKDKKKSKTSGEQGEATADGESKKKKKKKSSAIDDDYGDESELDPEVFQVCKDRMRAVKRALKAMNVDDGDDGKRKKDGHHQHRKREFQHHLAVIGAHIDQCLKEHDKDQARMREWRNNLWTFVSKFSDYRAKKLYKLYRHASKGSGNASDHSNVSNNNAPSSSSSHAYGYQQQQQQQSQYHHHPAYHHSYPYYGQQPQSSQSSSHYHHDRQGPPPPGGSGPPPPTGSSSSYYHSHSSSSPGGGGTGYKRESSSSPYAAGGKFARHSHRDYPNMGRGYDSRGYPDRSSSSSYSQTNGRSSGGGARRDLTGPGRGGAVFDYAEHRRLTAASDSPVMTNGRRDSLSRDRDHRDRDRRPPYRGDNYNNSGSGRPPPPPRPMWNTAPLLPLPGAPAAAQGPPPPPPSVS